MALELLSSTHVETRVSAIKLLSLMLVSHDLFFFDALDDVASHACERSCFLGFSLIWWRSAVCWRTRCPCAMQAGGSGNNLEETVGILVPLV